MTVDLKGLVEPCLPFMRTKLVISCTSGTAADHITSIDSRLNRRFMTIKTYVPPPTCSGYHGEAQPGISHLFEMSELCCCNMCVASRLYVYHSVVSKHPSTSQVLGVDS